MKTKTKKPAMPEGWNDMLIQQATDSEVRLASANTALAARESNIVPFGKYRGQPVEVLAQDTAYVDWLTAQPWFRESHKGIYTLIVNNFREPSETPEHNTLQAKFLDEEFCKRFVMAAIGRAPIRTRTEFESDGSDVALTYEYLTGSEGAKIDENHNVVYRVDKRGRKYPEMEDSTDFDYLRIEVKPSVGDDYPAVLRQIIASRERHYQRERQYKSAQDNYYTREKFPYVPPYGCAVLFLGSYTGVGVTGLQLRQMFARSSIAVVYFDLQVK